MCVCVCVVFVSGYQRLKCRVNETKTQGKCGANMCRRRVEHVCTSSCVLKQGENMYGLAVLECMLAT